MHNYSRTVNSLLCVYKISHKNHNEVSKLRCIGVLSNVSENYFLYFITQFSYSLVKLGKPHSLTQRQWLNRLNYPLWTHLSKLNPSGLLLTMSISWFMKLLILVALNVIYMVPFKTKLLCGLINYTL